MIIQAITIFPYYFSLRHMNDWPRRASLVGDRAMGHYGVEALVATIFDKIFHHGRIGQCARVAEAV